MKFFTFIKLIFSFKAILFASIAFLFFAFVILFFKCYRKWYFVSKMPGPKVTNPLLGNLDFVVNLSGNKKVSDWSQRGFDWLLSLAKKYEKEGLLRVWLGPIEPAVLLLSPETFEPVLSSHTLIDKADIYRLFKPFLGNGLGTSNGERWKANRKILNAAFSYQILANFFPIINEQQKTLIKQIEERANKEGVIDDIRPLISTFVLDTLCETAMGIQLKSQTQVESEYFTSLRKLSEIGLYISVRPWLWNPRLLDYTSIGQQAIVLLKKLHNFTDKVIKERKAEILQKFKIGSGKSVAEQLESCTEMQHSKKKRQMAFLDLVLSHHLKNPKHFKEKHVRAEVDTFTFAGHHTTASSVCWTLHLIANHPAVQKKIQQELDEIYNDLEQDVTFDDLRKMKYLECVIKESLRLYPAAPIIGRTANHDFKIGKYTIAKGTTYGLFIYFAHRNPFWYSDPEKFLPERFLPENSIGRHTYAFVPFSAGPRNCIGQKYAMMQEKGVLATILKKYEITALDSWGDVIPSVEFVLTPKSPIRIKFKSRKGVKR